MLSTGRFWKGVAALLRVNLVQAPQVAQALPFAELHLRLHDGRHGLIRRERVLFVERRQEPHAGTIGQKIYRALF